MGFAASPRLASPSKASLPQPARPFGFGCRPRSSASAKSFGPVRFRKSAFPASPRLVVAANQPAFPSINWPISTENGSPASSLGFAETAGSPISAESAQFISAGRPNRLRRPSNQSSGLLPRRLGPAGRLFSGRLAAWLGGSAPSTPRQGDCIPLQPPATFLFQLFKKSWAKTVSLLATRQKLVH